MLVQKGLAAMSERMPKVISPRLHAIADYVTIGGFFLLAAMFWKRNRRAAIGSLICGGSELTAVLLTDFPGGVVKKIDFPTHGKIDLGLAAATTMMPNMLAIEEEPEAKWFRLMGLNITAVGGMTDYGEDPRAHQERMWRRRGAA